MYRRRHPQVTMFESSYLVPEAKADRLRASWAETFRARALPLIDEDLFASLYCQDNGRPNRPVQTVLGVLILKDMYDLTDAEALERLEFDLLWHHALSLTPEEAHLPQKTLHNFRARLMAHEKGPLTFASITDGVLEALGTNVSQQRLDSTQVMSNIAGLTRLGLFCETTRWFLARLKDDHPRLYDRVPVGVLGRYLKSDGAATGYQDARSGDGPRREVVEDKQPPSKDDDDRGDGAVPVVLKDPKQVSSTSLQSPHDPDAGYSKRKGKGYEVQVAETCHADNVTEVITHVSVSPACGSDARQTIPTLEALAQRDQQPQTLVADTAYGSADNALDAERMGTELVSPVAGSAPVVEEVACASRPLTAADFEIDAALEDPAVCPGGHFATDQRAPTKPPNRVVLTFEAQTCDSCELFQRCPAQRHDDGDGYVLTVDLAAANLARRRRAETDGTFRRRYRIRAGIEATHSELKRRHGLGDLRVRGRPRVVLAIHLKAVACNLKRMVRALMPKPNQVIPATA